MTKETERPMIYAQLSKVMTDVEAIPKNKKNTMQGYSFRGIDDLYFALQGVMAKHGVVSVPKVIADRTEDRTTAKGSALIYRILTIEYTFFAADGSNVVATVIGEGMDSGDKASNKAMSVAQKYALLQVFCIPTEEHKDPEHDSHEVRHTAKPAVMSGFNPNHPDHMQQLRMFYTKAGLTDPKDLKVFADHMTGKPSSEMKKILDDLMGVPQ